MLNLLKLLGNAAVNSVLEAHVASPHKKIKKGAARAEAEEYIRAKYAAGAFVEKAGMSGEDLDLALWKCCRSGDAAGAMKFLAWGADAGHANTEERGGTCLHAVVESNPEFALECIELLTVNGADVNAVDGDENSVLDAAVARNEGTVVAFIVAKIENAV